jgi:hypothetical protein
VANSPAYICTITAVAFLVCACGPVAIQGAYKPPVLPLRIAVNTNGEITIESSAEFVTPLGVFEVGLVTDPLTYFDIVQNTLTIHIDSQDCIYDLNGQDFDVSFDPGLEIRGLEKEGDSIVVNVAGDFSGCQARYAAQSSFAGEHQCAAPYTTRLQLGSQAVVSTFQISVHTIPGTGTDLVRNKYLKRNRVVTVLEGPVCAPLKSGDLSWWWKVKSEEITFTNGQRGIVVGWVAEREDNDFLLAPK